jgi:integrase/recombinase XerD
MSMATFEKSPLTRAEVGELLRVCNYRSPTGCRDRALIMVLYGTGLRLFEALALRVSDIDLDAGTVIVQHGKGDKRRVAGMFPGSEAHLQMWLDMRRACGLSDFHPVFCVISGVNRGRQVSQSQVRAMMKRRGAKAGIQKRVHSHGLRHTHAAELDENGVPLTAIKHQLGHSSSVTTDIYLSRMTNKGAVSAVRAIGAHRKSAEAPAPRRYSVASTCHGFGIYDLELRTFLALDGDCMTWKTFDAFVKAAGEDQEIIEEIRRIWPNPPPT